MRDQTLKNVRASLASCAYELISQPEMFHTDLELAARLLVMCGKLNTEQQRQNQLDAIDEILQWRGTGKGRVGAIRELMDGHSSKHE